MHGRSSDLTARMRAVTAFNSDDDTLFANIMYVRQSQLLVRWVMATKVRGHSGGEGTGQILLREQQVHCRCDGRGTPRTAPATLFKV